MLLHVAAAARQLAPACSKLQLSPLLTCIRRTASKHGRGLSSWPHTSDVQQVTSSWRETLIAISSYTTYLQGHIQQLATSPLSLAGTRASASAHTLCVTATAAKAAAGAAPPGTSLSCFKSKSGPLSCNRSTLQLCQTRHYRTDSRGGYWLRQFGLADHTVTHLLMGANIAVFGLQMLWPEVTRALARVDPFISQGELWRLLTAAFVHGNIVHLGINMLSLYSIGHGIESVIGSRTFLVVYLGSAILGNIAGYSAGNGFQTSLGASGGLCGIYGGYLMTRWIYRKSWPWTASTFTSVTITLAANLALVSAFGGSIDTSAHLGGLLGGAALTYILSAIRRH